MKPLGKNHLSVIFPGIPIPLAPDQIKSNADVPHCLSVLLPVFNESHTIGQVLETVLAQRPVLEVIAVDDGSNDDSWLTLLSAAQKDSRLKLHQHDRNQGKGAALATALSHASGPIVIIQDADLEYDPSEYFLLLEPILANKADVVFGSRFLGSRSHRVLYFWHYAGNKLLTLLSNIFTNLNLTDMEVGLKVFRREVIQQIQIQEKRFGFEPEITAKISRLGVRIFEVAVSYNGRTYAEGKKITWRDGISALRCIVKYNLLR
jgi:glycosyltransferase involved in cell wall biosynthesis